MTVLFADKQQGGIDKSTLSGRLLEIRAELDRYHNEQSRLDLEMTNDNAEPVSIKLLRTRSSPREVIRRVSAVNLHHPFDQLMDASTFVQRKTLIHLVVSKIVVSKDKKSKPWSSASMLKQNPTFRP
ncbi:hypothetical protein ACFSR7_16110 [Cohnella sp. GCM10020058]|uniref:hypothetical protein n=1 Tax=Cohnella sp. GCM10020058 TaxID=3317330 RepID=UPI003627FF9C